MFTYAYTLRSGMGISSCSAWWLGFEMRVFRIVVKWFMVFALSEVSKSVCLLIITWKVMELTYFHLISSHFSVNMGVVR